jgi:TetR/AcrR family transcriptional regulator
MAERIDAGARARILDAALEAFASRGFDGATTSAIARTAGVTQPLVHYHFASKVELWRAAVDRELAAVVSSFAGILGQLEDLDEVDRLKVLVRRLVHIVAGHPELCRIISYEGAQGGDRLEWLLRRGGDGSGLQALDELLQSAMARGWIKELPVAHVATCLVAASAYFFIARHMVRQVYDLDVGDDRVVQDHADTVVEIFFHGLVPGSGAPTHDGRPAAGAEAAA